MAHVEASTVRVRVRWTADMEGRFVELWQEHECQVSQQTREREELGRDRRCFERIRCVY